MKKLLFLLWLLPFTSKSQDVITMKSGEDINAKVIEVATDEIKYKKSDDGPTYTIKKSEVFSIKYKDGTKDVFKVEATTAAKATFTDEELRLKGIQDAEKIYRGRKCGAGGVVATTLLLSPIIGLIPAIACSSTPPSEINMMMPRTDYSSNVNYSSAYRDQSHRIKKRKVWTAFGISIAVNTALLFALGII